jgi:hypothetical protein
MSAVAFEWEVLPMLKLKPLASAYRQSVVFNFEMGRRSPMSQRGGLAFDFSCKKTLINPSTECVTISKTKQPLHLMRFPTTFV